MTCCSALETAGTEASDASLSASLIPGEILSEIWMMVIVQKLYLM